MYSLKTPCARLVDTHIEECLVIAGHQTLPSRPGGATFWKPKPQGNSLPPRPGVPSFEYRSVSDRMLTNFPVKRPASLLQFYGGGWSNGVPPIQIHKTLIEPRALAQISSFYRYITFTPSRD